MARYRIFTNDRGTRRGIPMYSALMDVEAASPEGARKKCPTRFGPPKYAPPVAIHMPESTQSDIEKDWLRKHV